MDYGAPREKIQTFFIGHCNQLHSKKVGVAGENAFVVWGYAPVPAGRWLFLFFAAGVLCCPFRGSGSTLYCRRLQLRGSRTAA